MTGLHYIVAHPQLIPTTTCGLNLLAAAAYFASGRWATATYWLMAACLTGTITYLIPLEKG
jgi:hypothetical protein